MKHLKDTNFNRPAKVSLEDAITLAIHEESRLKLQNKIPQVPDLSINHAFIGKSQEKKAQSYLTQKRTWKSLTPDPKDSMWCTHCKKRDIPRRHAGIFMVDLRIWGKGLLPMKKLIKRVFQHLLQIFIN